MISSKSRQDALPPKELADVVSRCTVLRPGLLDYQQAWQLQQRIAASVRDGGPEALVLLQHPPVYTLGMRGREEHLLAARDDLGAEVVRTDRGGDVTFHGPGQVVGYPILDLRRRGMGPATYVHTLEAALVETLARFGIAAGRAQGRPGAWVGDAKIAAIGVRVSRGATTHGFALNVSTDLSYFGRIIPCGLAGAGVTSMHALGVPAQVAEVEDELCAVLCELFALEPAPQAEAAGVR